MNSEFFSQAIAKDMAFTQASMKLMAAVMMCIGLILCIFFLYIGFVKNGQAFFVVPLALMTWFAGRWIYRHPWLSINH